MFNLKWNNGGNYCESFFFFPFPPHPWLLLPSLDQALLI